MNSRAAARAPDGSSAVLEVWRLPTDEIWHFYLGDPAEMTLLFPDGSSRQVTLGQDLLAGQQLLPGIGIEELVYELRAINFQSQNAPLVVWPLGIIYGAVVAEKLAAIVYHAEARRGGSSSARASSSRSTPLPATRSTKAT